MKNILIISKPLPQPKIGLNIYVSLIVSSQPYRLFIEVRRIRRQFWSDYES